MLTALGYEISDDEQALRDGTHKIFREYGSDEKKWSECDYCKAARKNSVDRPEFYADLAAAFLEDKDAPEDKTGRYYHNIAAVQE